LPRHDLANCSYRGGLPVLRRLSPELHSEALVNIFLVTVIAVLALALSANIASRVAVDANGNQIQPSSACQHSTDKGSL